MCEQANSESMFRSSEALGTVKIVALALLSGSELSDDERKAAGRILQEAHYLLEVGKVDTEEEPG